MARYCRIESNIYKYIRFVCNVIMSPSIRRTFPSDVFHTEFPTARASRNTYAMGSVLAIIRENHPPKPTFKVDDVPDLEGKVIIITGANAGEELFMSIHNVG